MMEPIELSLNGYQLALINPGIHINTGWAFKQLQPATPAFSLNNLAEIDINGWQKNVVNDFQTPVSVHHPVIQHIINYCYQQGATYAAMTGSGSTCYALFPAAEAFPTFAPFAEFWIKKIPL